jgi:RNA polymerase-interacting CarD/CdnL/TRCF family regulator
LAGSAAAGAGVGAVITAMLSSHEHNHELDHFQTEISRGKLLLMVDVARSQVDDMRKLILEQHPEADIDVFNAKS